MEFTFWQAEIVRNQINMHIFRLVTMINLKKQSRARGMRVDGR